MNVSGAAHTQTWQKKKKSASDAKYWLKFNNIWLKYRATLIGICQGALKPNIPSGRRWGNACSSQNSSLKIETGVFPCPGAMITFSWSIILGISDTRVVWFDVFYAC